VGKAVETLAGLLDAGDGRLKRLAAKDILDQHGKFRELDELTRRIVTISPDSQGSAFLPTVIYPCSG
jgi:hypothetical protein